VGALTEGELDELREHAEIQLGSLVAKAEQHGVGVALALLGLRSRLCCHTGEGSPPWPAIVDAFMTLFTDPTNASWRHAHNPCPQHRPCHPGRPPVSRPIRRIRVPRRLGRLPATPPTSVGGTPWYELAPQPMLRSRINRVDLRRVGRPHR
jgi:hypothetical protein